MQALTLQCLNTSSCQDLTLSLSLGCDIESTTSSSLGNEPGLPLLSKIWVIQLVVVLVLSSPLLFRLLSATCASTTPATPLNGKDPSQVPYLMPVVGNLISYLLDAAKLASSITQTFGASTVVRLNFLREDVYVVSGAEYLNAVWKNTRGLTSVNGIKIALSNMFDTPKEDMMFFKADDSGITIDPHPQSSTKPENRVYYLMHKATVECLAGPHLTIAARKFQAALATQIEASPIADEWIEMEDLFRFVQPLISYATVEAMCGANFLRMFPDFVGDFWKFNRRMPKLLQGWPRWLMPKAWKARDRCVKTMKEWRTLCDEETFDGNAMILQRWSYFSKMQGLSKHGVACSDLGILWGMNSNSVPATFWLIWHLLRDRDLLTRVSREIDTCRLPTPSDPINFDTTKLCTRPLLQSCYAETLRKYVAVYIIRQPEHADARILDYRVPKGKTMVISSATAHTDPRNWRTAGPRGQYPVETFWAERFLTYGSTRQPPPPSSPLRTPSSTLSPTSTSAAIAKPDLDPPDPKFSLNGYSGAWVPFGGGIHQCPGRHWVKLQMLLGFAVFNAAFEIELLGKEGEELRVDMRKYGLGTLQPGERAGFRIRRRRRDVV